MTKQPWSILRAAAVVMLMPLVASCAGSENMMSPAGPAAARLARLGWVVLGLFVLVSAVMWALVFWTASRRRGSLETHLPWNAGGDQRWITIGGFAIPAVAFATIFVLMLRTMTAFPMGDGEMAGMAPAIRIVGHQWWWQVEYLDPSVARQVVTANELHVPVGRPVDVELRSFDVIHSFWVPRLHGKVDLVPGMVTHIRIEASEAGFFPGQCGEYCGPQHAHMVMLVVAQPPAEYARWLDHLRTDAAPPSEAMAAAGQRVFLARQCSLCHTVRGTDARGMVGPDLTHFAARHGLAANSLPNAIGPLSAWVTHAQSLKPLAQMPDLTILTGEEQQSLVAYLNDLR